MCVPSRTLLCTSLRTEVRESPQHDCKSPRHDDAMKRCRILMYAIKASGPSETLGLGRRAGADPLGAGGCVFKPLAHALCRACSLPFMLISCLN